MKWWMDARFGMFIHWGLYAMPARHEWVKFTEKMSDAEYRKYFELFDPDLFTPGEWARAAKNAGMKYLVVTAKHHDGFCLWDSKYTDYKITNTPFRRNALAEIVGAFRSEGLRIGVYYSLIDWHHPEFEPDKAHPWNHEEIKASGIKRDRKKYALYMRNQVEELLTQFGKIDIIWFDFSYPDMGKGHKEWESEELVSLIRKLQPDILINNRLDLPDSADFVTPEQYVPANGIRDVRGRLIPWEGCQTFSGSWGYHRDENTWKTSEMLIQMLVNHVSCGGNLLLNIGPTARGVFDRKATQQLQEIGQWMFFHSRSIHNCGPAPEGILAPEDCRYTWNPETGRLYLHLFVWPFKTLHLPGLAGKVKYAQLLNDASEIKFRESTTALHSSLKEKTPLGSLSLDLPHVKPDVNVPVIELFMKKG